MVAFSLLSILMYACKDDAVSPDSANSAEIAIVDEQGVGVAGAIIEVITPGEEFLLRDTTDELGVGRIRFIADKKASSTVRIFHEDFDTLRSSVNDAVLHSKSNPVLMKHLDACSGRLTITVRKSSDSSLISGAIIRLNRNNQRVRLASTNETGSFTFDNVCPGTYWIRIARDGYKVVEESITLYNDTTGTVFYLQSQSTPDTCCHGVIAINLRSKYSGAIVNNANVRLRKGGVELAMANAENGFVKFRELCPGEYNIRVAADNYKVLEFSQAINCGDSVNLEKQVTPDSCCNNKYTLKLTNLNTGAVVPEAKVILTLDGVTLATKYTNNDGVCVFENVCSGLYLCFATKTGFSVGEISFRVSCDDNIEVEKRMAPTECCFGSVTIHLRDGNGQPLNDASVFIRRSIGNSIPPQSYENGIVRFGNICEGDYTAVCSKTNYTSQEFSFHIGCHDTLNFEKVMPLVVKDTCCTAVIKLRIKDSISETNLQNAIVKVRSEGETIRTIGSNVEGWATANELCAPHTYTFTVSRDGYKTKEFTISTKNCETIQETIRLAPAKRKK